MENRKCLAIIAALLAFAIALSLPTATTCASQPNVTKIAVENCQYSAGTVWHSENIVSGFDDNDSVFFGDWKYYADDNCVADLGTGIAYLGKNDNTGVFDNAYLYLENIAFNENLENVQIHYAWWVEDNVGLTTMYLKPIIENTSGENTQFQTTLDIGANDGWHYYTNDLTSYITEAADNYKIYFRAEIQDNGEDLATPNIRLWFDNITFETKYRGSSDNITIGVVNFAYTENSRTSAGTLGLPIEENFTVTADNNIDITIEFDPVATGMTWENVRVNGTGQTYTTPNENAKWTFSATVSQVENVELLYRMDVLLENWATIQTSSSHQIGTDDNVAYRISVDVGTDFAVENLYLIVSLPDPTSLDNADNAKVSGSYVETATSGENLTFKIDNVKNENSFTIDYYQNGATYAFVSVVSTNGDQRRYTWTLTNPSGSHTYENCKFTIDIAEIAYRVAGTETVTWGGSELSGSQYSISGQTVAVDPDLSAGDTTFTVEFQREATGPIFPVGGPSAQATTTTPPPAVTTTTPPPSEVVTPEVVLIILIVIVVAAVVAVFAKH